RSSRVNPRLGPWPVNRPLVLIVPLQRGGAESRLSAVDRAPAAPVERSSFRRLLPRAHDQVRRGGEIGHYGGAQRLRLSAVMRAVARLDQDAAGRLPGEGAGGLHVAEAIAYPVGLREVDPEGGLGVPKQLRPRLPAPAGAGDLRVVRAEIGAVEVGGVCAEQ